MNSPLCDLCVLCGNRFFSHLELLASLQEKLNEIEKAIILLYLEGRSYDEIAGITGFTTTNVGTRLGRIKQKLMSQIN